MPVGNVFIISSCIYYFALGTVHTRIGHINTPVSYGECSRCRILFLPSSAVRPACFLHAPALHTVRAHCSIHNVHALCRRTEDGKLGLSPRCRATERAKITAIGSYY